MNGDEELSRGVMGALCGVPIYESELATRPVVRETRVRGGYMNHWLIRTFVTVQEPTAYAVAQSPAGRPAVIAHPEVAARLRRSIARKAPRFDQQLRKETKMRRYEFEGGKYAIVVHDDASMSAERYWQPWRPEITGDKLIHAMLNEIDALKARIFETEGALVEARDALETCQTEPPGTRLKKATYNEAKVSSALQSLAAAIEGSGS